MQRSCKKCRTTFEITEDDLRFYEKVSPVFGGKKELIPPPTLCPECRQQRRAMFVPRLVFHQRASALSGKRILSIYPESSPFPVYGIDEWWSDSWDAMTHGISLDQRLPFLQQFKTLLPRVPRMANTNNYCENCDYCYSAGNAKNCFHCAIVHRSEEIYYSEMITGGNSNLMDCYRCQQSQHLYQCWQCINCALSTFLVDCVDVSDSHYCFDCIGCSHCLLCSNLRHKQYVVRNRQVSKEEYQRIFEEELPPSSTHRQKMLSEFATVRAHAIHKGSNQVNCEGCTGDNLFNCSKCIQCYSCFNCEDCCYCWDLAPSKRCMSSADITIGGIGELLYNTAECGGGNYLLRMVFQCRESNDLAYCADCFLCQYCFGCIGLRSKRYCILNKQYTKEEYERLVPKIIEKMRQDGEWGEFFPVELSPFAYNETVAQEYFPLTKEEILKLGWKWRDQKDEIQKVSRIIPASQLPDSIDDIPDDILNWAIECEVTKRPFRIIRQELGFYRKMRLPIPRLHPDERHRRRMALRNPRKLWNRACAKCRNPIATSYSPDRPEIVYCEECYLREVY